MKILTIARPKDLLLSLPEETRTQMAKGSVEPTKKMKDKGKVLAHYYSPTSRYVIAIVDYDDAEEWMKDLMSNPVMAYYDQDIYPIVDLGEAVKLANQT
jgi:muconolactone delta-isomerase